MSSAPQPVEQPNRWRDVLAGLSIAGLLLPEAVAYSTIAALAPQAGVIALFDGLLCYGVFGTSRFAIVSATSSSAAVLAAATATLANGDPQLRSTLAVGLVLVTGGLFLLAGLFRLGSVTAFIAKPVLRGFAFGLALTTDRWAAADKATPPTCRTDAPAIQRSRTRRAARHGTDGASIYQIPGSSRERPPGSRPHRFRA